MKILAVARFDPETTPEKMRPHLEAEVEHAWRLYKEGTFREMYDRQDGPGVVIVLECGSVDEARGALAGLPLVREKVIDFEIVPLAPFSYWRR